MGSHRESSTGTHHKKPRSAGVYSLIYDRNLHPELFTIDARRVRLLGNFEITMWLLAGGGHVATVAGPHLITEVFCFPNKALNDHGLLERIQCKGDKQYDKALGEDYHYYLAINEEHTTEALFETAVMEMLRLAAEQDGLIAHKKNAAGRTEYLSILVAQFHRLALHVEGFHLLGEQKVLIRTQSIIEPVRH